MFDLSPGPQIFFLLKRHKSSDKKLYATIKTWEKPPIYKFVKAGSTKKLIVPTTWMSSSYSK